VQSLGGINIFILLSTAAFVYCAPLAYVMESHKWSATIEAARASVGNQHLMFLMALSAVLYTVLVSLPFWIATPARKTCSLLLLTPLQGMCRDVARHIMLHTWNVDVQSARFCRLAGVQRVFISGAGPGLFAGHIVRRWVVRHCHEVSELVAVAVMRYN
jgi:hypothetical protein